MWDPIDEQRGKFGTLERSKPRWFWRIFLAVLGLVLLAPLLFILLLIYDKVMGDAVLRASMDGDLRTMKIILAIDRSRVNEGWDSDLTVFNEHADCDQMLSVAINNRHKDVAKYLVAKGADVNHKGYFKQTPLHYAAEWGETDVIRDLLAHGADPNVKDFDGGTPLGRAIRTKNKAAAALLGKYTHTP
jgi:ankyrin repeat protein